MPKVSLTVLLIPRALEEKPLGPVYIPRVEGISENLKCIGNH
jgi:hypothetical protein